MTNFYDGLAQEIYAIYISCYFIFSSVSPFPFDVSLLMDIHNDLLAYLLGFNGNTNVLGSIEWYWVLQIMLLYLVVSCTSELLKIVNCLSSITNRGFRRGLGDEQGRFFITQILMYCNKTKYLTSQTSALLSCPMQCFYHLSFSLK